MGRKFFIKINQIKSLANVRELQNINDFFKTRRLISIFQM